MGPYNIALLYLNPKQDETILVWVTSLAQEFPHTMNVAKKGRYKILKDYDFRSSHRGSVEMHLTRVHEDAGSIPDLAQWVKDLVLP